MKNLLLVVAVALALQQREPPPPGNPDHIPPKEGEYCTVDQPTRDLPPEAKACECHEWRTCTKDPETGQRVVVEHFSCKSWCFKDHCQCPMHCEDTE